MSIFNLNFAVKQFPEILQAVPATLFVAVTAMAAGLIFGFFIAICRIYKLPILNKIAVLYVSFIRGTPLLVQIYVIFYGIPELMDFLNKTFSWSLNPDGISPFLYAFIAYTINTSAFQSEIIRSAITSTDAGQMEAAYSVGMNTAQGLTRIIIPQAFEAALPNLGNTFIGLVKGTSLAFAVKVIEIMAVAKTISNQGYMFLEMYVDAAIVYWVICFALERFFALLENKAGIRKEKVNFEVMG